MWRERLVDLLTALEPDQLETFAVAFLELARAAKDRSRRIAADRKSRDNAAATVAALPDLAGQVAARISAGAPRALALQIVAAGAAVPVETVEHHCKIFARGRDLATYEARRLAIVRRALEGRRNAEIAAELGISRRTVERALKGVNFGRISPAASPSACQDRPGEAFKGSVGPTYPPAKRASGSL